MIYNISSGTTVAIDEKKEIVSSSLLVDPEALQEDI